MSKKTIYNHFESKAALGRACIEASVQSFRQQAEAILHNVDLSLRQKLTHYFQLLGASYAQVNHEFMQDIKRSEPETWEYLSSARREFLQLYLGQLMDEAARVGYIRDDSDRRLAVLVYISAVEQLGDPDFLMQFPPSFASSVSSQLPDRANQLIHLLMRGLLTPKFWNE